jgi:metal-responsive CopG/Arc/MetJ family transcriptional regulator
MWNDIHNMETIQVVLDSKLLKATDGAAKRARMNRSALIRQALREHLRALRVRELERRDREGYTKIPHDPKFSERWERVASWPEQ